MQTKPAITLQYCSQCNWMLRASWMAQELLHSFSTDLGSVTLVPGTGGIFVIDIDGKVIWDRKVDGGFPDAAELKRRVRDYCFPDKDLGHLEKKNKHQGMCEPSIFDARASINIRDKQHRATLISLSPPRYFTQKTAANNSPRSKYIFTGSMQHLDSK
jgi:selenoprotein W-related protein